MADKKEVNILLLGIVAILAIVGLVLLFTSPAATGKAFALPADNVQSEQIQNPYQVTSLDASQLPLCPNGHERTPTHVNLPYSGTDGKLCSWFSCPGSGSDSVLACMSQ